MSSKIFTQVRLWKQRTNPINISLLLLVTLCLFHAGQLQAQTRGLIVKPAGTGQHPLDPNGDGYVSATTAGFFSNDEAESEIPFKPIQWPQGEPLLDLERGPGGGFTDFSYIGTNLHPVYTYTSPAGNLMFRFRLGGIAPNSKGYSILIDTDNRFGNTGTSADPNYSAANPGFEVEIVLASNFGVYVYNVDGVSNPAVGSQVLSYSYANYAQKAIAWSTQGGDADYFYDFYVPMSAISAYFNGTNGRPTFNASTKVRMVANTVMSPHSALRGPISDVGGVDDRNFSTNLTSAWSFITASQLPASVDTTTSHNLPAIRSAAPTVSSPISAGSTSVSGSSSEANNTEIRVFVNGTSVGTTTVSNGSWTITGLTALTAGQRITATATAPNKSVSLVSSEVTVTTTFINCATAVPAITGQETNNRGLVGTAPANATVRIYHYSSSSTPAIYTTTASSTGTWSYNFCTISNHCLPCGTYYATATTTANGGCESAYSSAYCASYSQSSCTSYATATAPPTISTSPITSATTTIQGTATSGAIVFLYKDNNLVGTTTATGGNWSFTNQQFTSGQSISVIAQASGNCVSAAATASVTSAPMVATTAPVVNAPIYSDVTRISGTSVEAEGTTINVRMRGTSGPFTSIGTTTVDAYGNWSLTGFSTQLIAGQNITAIATATGKTVSAASSAVPIQTRPAIPAAPSVTGPLFEQGTSVSGTGPANTTINVYIDGGVLGIVSSDGSGNWTVSGLSAQYYDLYAGGQVYATTGTAGTNESGRSNIVTVECNPGSPLTNLTVSPASATICSGSTQEVQIQNSETGVIYTLRNNANTADMSSSVLGTGGTITLTTYPLTSSQTLKIRASKAESTYCSPVVLDRDITMTVNPLPITSLLTYGSSVCSGTAPTIMVENSQNGLSYQLRNHATNALIGPEVIGNGGIISLPATAITSAQTYNVLVTDRTRPTNCSAQLTETPTVTIGCPAVYTVRPAEYIGRYSNDDNMATVTAANSGVITSAILISGTLPAGATLNTTTGAVQVANANALTPGSYPLTIRTTDTNGSITYHNITVGLLATPLPVELLSFRAEAANSEVKLNWTTASEKNNAYFAVERSNDGRNFGELGRVDGAGNSNSQNHYNFTDRQPLSGTGYYRLRQVDTDGTFKFSAVVKATTASVAGASMQVYPNPFRRNMSLHLTMPKAEQVTVYVHDMFGKLLYEQTVSAHAGQNELNLELGHLSSGIYQVSITTPSGQLLQRIVKQ